MVTDVQTLTGKELLLSVARELFLKDGYNGVSIQQIAEAAHMTKGSPYYHFKNKEDLFIQVFDREVHRTMDGFAEMLAISGTLHERVFRAFRYILLNGNEGFARIRDDFDRYILPKLDQSQRSVSGITPDTMRALFRPLIEDAQARGLRIRFSEELASTFLFLVVIGHTELSRWDHGETIPVEQVDAYANELTSFVLHGLITSPEG